MADRKQRMTLGEMARIRSAELRRQRSTLAFLRAATRRDRLVATQDRNDRERLARVTRRSHVRGRLGN